jgi:hypothetical protein
VTEKEKPPKERQAASAAKEKLGSLGHQSSEAFRSVLRSSFFRDTSPFTKAGYVLAMLFVVFMFVDTFNVRWWLMLPLGAGGMYIFWYQWRVSLDVGDRYDAKFCLWGLVGLGVLVLFRDAYISSSLAEIHDAIQEIPGAREQFFGIFGE